MNSAGLVAISLLFGIMLVVILGGMAVLGVFLYRLRMLTIASQEATEDLFARMDESFTRFLGSFADQTEFQAEEQERLDADRSTEVKSLQSSLGQFRTETRQALEAHRKGMDEKLEALNAPALQAASVRIVGASTQLAKAAVLLQELIINQDERETNDTGLGPEEYAAPDRSSLYQSETAYSDAQVERDDEAAESEGPATRIHETQGVLA